jgi:hypothetical protein
MDIKVDTNVLPVVPKDSPAGSGARKMFDNTCVDAQLLVSSGQFSKVCSSTIISIMSVVNNFSLIIGNWSQESHKPSPEYGTLGSHSLCY